MYLILFFHTDRFHDTWFIFNFFNLVFTIKWRWKKHPCKGGFGTLGRLGHQIASTTTVCIMTAWDNSNNYQCSHGQLVVKVTLHCFCSAFPSPGWNSPLITLSLSHSNSLATKPGVLSVCPGDKGNLSGHFCIVDALAAFIVPPLPLSARLLEVTLALHRFNDAILS